MKNKDDELKAVIINGDNENKDDIDKLIKAFCKELKAKYKNKHARKALIR